MGKRIVRAAMAALAGAMLCAGVSLVYAQGSVTGTKTMSRDADPDWEAVTVRPTDPDAKDDPFVIVGRHLTMQNRTVENLMLMGYGVQKSQIAGAPEWVRTAHFDVDGVPDVEGQPNTTQVQGLMRKLLAERFGLKMHMEPRVMPVYALLVAKGGARLVESKGDPSGLPDERMLENGGERTFKMANSNVVDLTLMLKNFLDRPVVDQTGLKGRYDFELRYTFDELRARPDGNASPVVFTAIQEQLGLKLEPARASADVLVVDAVQRPTAN
jgi:uncharacterized protein (TIGR03435 family)